MASTGMAEAHSVSDDSSVSVRLAPTVPEDKAHGRSGLVVSCPDHALPFGIIFEEYAARRKEDLEKAAKEVFCCVFLEKAFPKLQDWMIERHEKYCRKAAGGANPEVILDINGEIERILPAKKLGVAPEKIVVLKALLKQRERDYLLDLAKAGDPKTWRHPNDQFRTLAEEICSDRIPEPLEKLRKWLAKRDATYAELASKKREPSTPPSTIDELEAKCFELDRPLKRLLHKMKGSAVCLSGGGIRSASFGLGVLEGLARFSVGELPKTRQIPDAPDSGTEGLLHSIDYLSTVSGGGYIGSWLTSWVYRRCSADRNELVAAKADLEKSKKDFANLNADPSASDPQKLRDAECACRAAQDRLSKAQEPSWKRSYKQVVRALAGDTNLTSGDPEPQPVRHVRQYTSYLAPAMGLSLDSWDLAAIVSRNMLINWLMLAPVLLGLVALPQISYYVTRYWGLYLQGWGAWAVMAAILLLFIAAAVFAGIQMPSHREAGSRGPDLQSVLLGFTVPVLAANWLIAELWYADRNTGTNALSVFYIGVFVVSCIGYCVSATFLFAKYCERVKVSEAGQTISKRFGRIRAAMYGAALTSALVTTLLLATLSNSIFPRLARTQGTKVSFSGVADFVLEVANRHDLVQLVKSNPAQFEFPADERLWAVLAFPLVAMVLLISYSFFAGLLGVFELEEDREWMSRAGGMQLAILVAWIAAHALTLYATNVITAIQLGVSGAILGGIGSALGWSGATSAGPRPVKVSQLGKIGSFLKKYDLLLPTLCAVALLLIVIGAAGVEQDLATRINRSFYFYFEPPLCVGGLSEAIAIAKLTQRSFLVGHIVVFGCCFVAALLLNWAININLFSLHGMYRMRLMRAFLGASNVQQAPDLFTQFDPKDTPGEIDLAANAGVPLHVINSTLNLVGTKNLAWRQRKAASFTFSPLHSGCWRLAYVPTQTYAGIDGVSVATAMAISGAAFNPNMGYHSSPLVTLLMTFFNVRLGWWLPNPVREGGARYDLESSKGADFLHKTGPTIALEPLILEALGMTDESYRWIELTDGGHFENLGLYEMVLRRCKNIIVVDAGADPDCQFEDLGNALRKIEIDLGIPIRFNSPIQMEKGAKPTNRYCAVADIDYGCVDDSKKLPPTEQSNLTGKLVYIKAALTGGEPPDIAQYAATHSTFPHETTANQFFNESQFESYRHLGSYEIETIVPKQTTEEKPTIKAGEFRVESQLVERSPGSYGIETILMMKSPVQAVDGGTDFDSFVRSAEGYLADPAKP